MGKANLKVINQLDKKSEAGYSEPYSKLQSMINILKGFEEFTLDTRGIIVSSNLEAVNITGYEEAEIIGEPLSVFYCADEKTKATFDLERAKRLGHCVVTGIKLRKSGISFWAKMKISASFDLNNSFTGYKVVMQDTTYRALSNARVQSLKEEYLAIFNNPFVGAFKFRLEDYKIQLCNPKTLEIANREHSLNLYFNELFQQQEQFEYFIGLLKKEKKVEGFKFLINDTRSNENWGVISARYFGGKGFVEGVVFDISEQHSQMLELRRVNSELDKFTYHASHDLRAPLTTIMGLINLMKLEPIENAHKFIGIIENRVNHLDLILRDLASVTYNNSTKVERVEFNFKDEVKFLNASLNLHTGININIEINQNYSHFTDPVRMRTILRNVLLNASSFHKSDSDDLEIDLWITVESKQVIIKVHDNGDGISIEAKEKVWDIFFRATNRYTGTGLGLYIVRSMVEKLKGSVAYDSNSKDGTSFLIVIPNIESNEI